MQGGIQVNAQGRRFCDETRGYSEQAAEVLRQPGAIAWDIFDARIAAAARQFEDFQTAERAGAILTAQSIGELAAAMRVPADVFGKGVELRGSAQGARGGGPLWSAVCSGTAVAAALSRRQGDRRALFIRKAAWRSMQSAA